jgi:hypothetical protein
MVGGELLDVLAHEAANIHGLDVVGGEAPQLDHEGPVDVAPDGLAKALVFR